MSHFPIRPVNSPINRRTALKIIAAATVLSGGATIPLARRSKAATYRWQGRALGVEAEMQFVHEDGKFVRKMIAHCVTEIDRLEDIFSLYRPDSAINRLNHNGFLKFAAPELRTVLAAAQRISALSAGAFDVTVQPFWQDQHAPLDRVDFKQIEMIDGGIRFRQKNMAITLNGIAQGFITDRIAQILTAEGFNHILLQLGEIHAKAPANQPWQIALNHKSGKKIALSSGAIATSSATPNHRHLIDPQTGEPPSHYNSVSVIAPTAMTADALSTALYVATPSQAENLVKNTAVKMAIFEHLDGEINILTGA